MPPTGSTTRSTPRPSVSSRTRCGDVVGGVVDAVVHAVLVRAARAARRSTPWRCTTLAPAALASWIAASPTPPAPAWTSTVSPACRWPNSNRQSSAVPNSIGTPAACLDRQAVGDRVRPTAPAPTPARRGCRSPSWRRPAGRRSKPVDRRRRPRGPCRRPGSRRRAGSWPCTPPARCSRSPPWMLDGLDLEDDPARSQLGVGHVDVLEHVGPAGAACTQRPSCPERPGLSGCHAQQHSTSAVRAPVGRHASRRSGSLSPAAASPVAQRAMSWSRSTASITASKRRRPSTAPSRRTVGRVDVEQPVDLGVARAALGVPRPGADLDVSRLAASTSGPRRTGRSPWRPMIDDRPVLAERRVVLERHPRPHDLAGVGIAVEVRRVLDADAGVDGARRRLPCAASCARCCGSALLERRRDAADQPRGDVEPSGHRVRVGRVTADVGRQRSSKSRAARRGGRRRRRRTRPAGAAPCCSSTPSSGRRRR